MFKVLFLYILLFSFNSFAHASAQSILESKCTTIDESKSSYIGPMDDQADYNTCYAFVASYLVGHYLKSEINPEHIAVHFEFGVDGSRLPTAHDVMTEGYGQVDKAIAYQSKKGFLLECNDKSKSNVGLHPIDYLKDMEKSCPKISSKYTKNLKPVRNHVEDVGRDNAVAKIDELLDKKQISAVFASSRFFKGFHSRDTGLHVMTVVGRRFNPETSSCEYVLRNTRGPDVFRDIKTQGPYNYRYEAGHFVVSRDYLKDYMSGIYYLEKNL